MIHTEPWYKEAQFDREWQQLLQLAERGGIDSGEFMRRALRLWGKRSPEGPVHLMGYDEDSGRLILTQDWMYHHQDWVQEIEDIGKTILWMVDYRKEGLGRIALQVPFRFMDFFKVLLVMYSLGNYVGNILDREELEGIITEEEFNALMRRTLEEGREVVRMADSFGLL